MVEGWRTGAGCSSSFCWVTRQKGREGCVGSNLLHTSHLRRSLPSRTLGLCLLPALLPHHLHHWSLNCTWLPPWQFLSPVYWMSCTTGMSLCPANTYSYSPLQPESHVQTWSEECRILFLHPERNIQSKPVNLWWCFSEALPIQKIYVAFLSRRKPKNYSFRIHHLSLLSWGNGLLIK